MKSLILNCACQALAVLTLSGMVMAQQTAPLPPGPLVAKPDSAQWQVTISIEKPGVSTGEKTVAKVKTITVQGSLRHEESKDASGSTLSTWCQGDNEYFKPGTSGQYFVCPPNDEVFYIPHPGELFGELSWISATKFLGIKNVNGKPCLVFGETGPSLTAPQLGDLLSAEVVENGQFKKSTLKRVAYIDQATRLPLYLHDGVSNYVYQFGPAPTTPLVLPDSITAMLKAQQELTRRMSLQPSRS